MSLLLYNSRRQFVSQLHEVFSFSDYSSKQQFLGRNPNDTFVLSDQSVSHRLYTKNVFEPSFYADSLLSNVVHFYATSTSTSVSSFVFIKQIHVRSALDRYQSIDQVNDNSIHILNIQENELTIDVGLATQIITGLGVTEQINVSDNLTSIFGKPVPIVPPPGINFVPTYFIPSPLDFPRFPVNGYSLSFNVELTSVSLVQNTVSNNIFSAGLYVMYQKNNAVWYRFKTAAASNAQGEIWSSEYLLYSGTGTITNETNFTGDVGVQNSKTIFDSNGYPITAFVNTEGFIGVQYFTNGMPIVANTQIKGISLNLIVVQGAIILMWIPENYTNFLYYSDSNAAFQASCPYYVAVPGNLQSFSLTQNANFDWVFSFSTLIDNEPNVYYASTVSE